MERKALIIYCDNTPPSEILEGPPFDNVNYTRFLLSKYGGAWETDEIISLHNPTKNDVIRSMRRMNGFDYTFTIFTGHGDMIQDKWGTWNQRCQVLDDDILLSDLKTDAIRKTIIIDACRKQEKIKINERFEKAIKTFSLMESLDDKKFYRYMYDESILDADEGITVLYSSRENQASKDTENGGAFLCTLLRCKEIWINENTSNILRLDELMKMAINNISIFYPETDQVPSMSKFKRNTYFPFAVNL